MYPSSFFSFTIHGRGSLERRIRIALDKQVSCDQINQEGQHHTIGKKTKQNKNKTKPNQKAKTHFQNEAKCKTFLAKTSFIALSLILKQRLGAMAYSKHCTTEVQLTTVLEITYVIHVHQLPRIVFAQRTTE